jgi:hypothetical protein
MNMTEVGTDFEREKLCYQQNFEHARSLNHQMNQIPTLAMTLTGGLWFAAGVTERMEETMRFGLLLFASICDFSLALAILRVRDVFNSYLEKVRTFHPASYSDGHPTSPKLGWMGDYSMVSVYCTLMITAALLSIIGAFAFYWPYAERLLPVGAVCSLGVLASLGTHLFKSWRHAAAVAVGFAIVTTLLLFWIRNCL